MNDLVVLVTASVLTAAAAGFLYRMLRGPSLADRIVGFDGLLSVVVIGILTHATHTGTTAMLPVVIVLSLLAFSGTALFGRFIESGDDRG
ncbi:MAG: monovalent cation/H+ antiporter complex subunit F [Acidimicrobiia bacterium]